MKLVRVTGISELKSGDRVRFRIDRRPIADSVIYIPPSDNNPNNILCFLCQNEFEGVACEEEYRYGYRFSWAISGFERETTPFARSLRFENVTAFRKLVKGET